MCTKYGKNPSRTVCAVELTRQNVPYFSSFIAKSWLNDLEDIGQGHLHDTPSHASDHSCLIWKESIQNCRSYRVNTACKTDGQMDGLTDGRTDIKKENKNWKSSFSMFRMTSYFDKSQHKYRISLCSDRYLHWNNEGHMAWHPKWLGYPDSKVHGANMGPTWVLSAPDGPHVGPMNLAIRVALLLYLYIVRTLEKIVNLTTLFSMVDR